MLMASPGAAALPNSLTGITEQPHDPQGYIIHLKREDRRKILRPILQQIKRQGRHFFGSAHDMPMRDIRLHRPAKADDLRSCLQGLQADGAETFIGRRVQQDPALLHGAQELRMAQPAG